MRIPLALLFACGAVAAGMLTGGAAPSGEVVTVVRTTTDVAVGESLEVGDLQIVEVDADAAPDEVQTATGGVDALVGRQAAVPLPAGAVILDSQLVGPGLLQGQGEGVVAMPVRPADTALLGMLTPGRRVDVLVSGTGPQGVAPTETVAQDAPVLWTPQRATDDWLPSSGEAGEVVILAVEPEVAERLAEAAHRGRIHLSLVE